LLHNPSRGGRESHSRDDFQQQLWLLRTVAEWRDLLLGGQHVWPVGGRYDDWSLRARADCVATWSVGVEREASRPDAELGTGAVSVRTQLQVDRASISELSRLACHIVTIGSMPRLELKSER